MLCRDFGRSVSAPLYAYRQEIFDLIVDYYEEDYLRRSIRPRRGRPRNEEEAREVRRFQSQLLLLRGFDGQVAALEKKTLRLGTLDLLAVREVGGDAFVPVDLIIYTGKSAGFPSLGR